MAGAQDSAVHLPPQPKAADGRARLDDRREREVVGAAEGARAPVEVEELAVEAVRREAADGEVQRVHGGAGAVGSGEQRRRGARDGEGEVAFDEGRDGGGVPGDRARDGQQRVQPAEAFGRTGGVQEVGELGGVRERA